MHNFNHERFVISAGALGMCRKTYELSMKEALVRKTFGVRLVDHQVIRAKLGEMARLVEALQDNVERCAYQFSKGVPDRDMGGQCALLKVMASKSFEYCAREAAQIFGGSSLVREGKGMAVERLYREVRGTAIPGGSEEILLDLAVKQAVRFGLSRL
jgi:alkylation response protein AidB-like acyl-CoA dehydrogenase